MTVRAADDALLDLRLDDDDRRGFAHERADGATFLTSNMVELHDERIEEPAINARVREQILFDEAPITRAVQF